MAVRTAPYQEALPKFDFCILASAVQYPVDVFSDMLRIHWSPYGHRFTGQANVDHCGGHGRQITPGPPKYKIQSLRLLGFSPLKPDITAMTKSCPFKAGDLVVYRPSQRSYDQTAMYSERLVPGHTYRVKEIQEGVYVLPEGYNHPSGGIYWTEFSAS